MSDEKTDNTDEPTKAELHDRVRKLESTVEKLMPSRRDALKLGAAGIAGAAGLSATTQPADAATGSAGQIGDVNNRPDVFADTVDANQLTGVTTGGIKTKTRAFLSSGSPADPVPFDAVSYDPDNNFDTAAHEYVAPANGTYQIAFNARLVTSVAAGTRVAFNIERNGSRFITAEADASGDRNTIQITDVRELTSGDSLAVRNAFRTTVSGGNPDTFLSVIRLE